MCADAVTVGQPVTERLMAEGCLEGDGSVTILRPFVCAFRGYTALNHNDEVVAIELTLSADEPRPSAPADHIYGRWISSMAGSGQDAAGCVDRESVPDPLAS